MDNDMEPPSYDHAIQSDEKVLQYGKYKDASYDSFERGEMFIQAFSSRLDIFPAKEAEEIKEKDYLSVVDIDDQTQRNGLFKHPSYAEAFRVQNKNIYFWPHITTLPLPEDLDFTAQATHPFLPMQGQSETHHYFEISVRNVLCRDTVIAIGLSTRPYPLFRMPGWNKFSVGYHSDDGNKFCDDATGGQDYGPPWGPGDTIGCGYCPEWGQVYFTKNGQKLDVAFTHLSQHHYYPSIGVDGPANIQVNFGHLPFQYKLY